MKECQHCKICYADDVDSCPADGMPTVHTISGEPVLEGKYQLLSRIGQGGMGVVYRARHAYLKTLLAVKIILPDLVGNDPELVTRFRQEALAAAAIRHPNVVQVTDYGVAQGTMPFLVMEFVEGEDLHDFLEHEKKLEPVKAYELISAICKGIGAAHKQGIVHRDMKPLNIMLLKGKTDMSEAVKILDFGLAKIKSGELLGSFIQAQTTGLMGSPFYMAPEQWSDDELDGRSDIYSIGVMLFQMLAGDVPFKGSSIPSIMKKHLTDAPPSFADMGVSIDPQLEKVVRHALEKERDDRTATVEDFIEEMEMALGISSSGTTLTSSTITSTSTLKVLTSPPNSKVYMDGVFVGESGENGWLIVDDLKNGSHKIGVSYGGYQDWEKTVVLEGTETQVVAELRAGGIPKPDETSLDKSVSQETPQSMALTQQAGGVMQNTADQNQHTGSVYQHSEAPVEKSIFSPIVFVIIGIFGLLGLTAIGGVGAYMAGLFGGANGVSRTDSQVTTTPTKEGTHKTESVKNEMVLIPGGEFNMGRNDGLPQERPEHKVTVNSFWMDKTEVTNAEYYEFVKGTGNTHPKSDWEDNKPLPSILSAPVRFVSFDDAKRFAEWRTKRDGVTYRLPTEEEWEFAARNGGQNDLYPWGDEYKDDCAVLDESSNKPKAVGTKDCGKNIWGVDDLIGNVYEWTSTKASLYPGNPGNVKKLDEPQYMIRGGGAIYKSKGKNAITSTSRTPISATERNAGLGFRLVRSE